jgi:hypothetical protein
MRHRTHERRDRNQRGSLALSPADEAPSGNSYEQRVLATVPFGSDFGHGEIEEIDGFNCSHGKLRHGTGMARTRNILILFFYTRSQMLTSRNPVKKITKPMFAQEMVPYTL